jgi:riboflavin kinase/FMN adenylyltransferase
VLTFDAALASLTADEFVASILVGRFALSGAVIGFNFHFGKNRGGSPDFLVAEGKKRDFAVDVVSPFMDNGRPISSGPIRKALTAGNVEEAAELLGFPWFVSGKVIHGDKRGRELGFPTANLSLDPACGLRHGIYAVRVAAGGRRYDGVASFGRRPMYDSGTVLLEVFLFDFAGDLYGQSIDVVFISRLRDERLFASAAELTRQMQEDSRRAHEILARAGDAFPPI